MFQIKTLYMDILQEERNGRYVQEFASLKVDPTSSRIIPFCLFWKRKKTTKNKKEMEKTKDKEKRNSVSKVISRFGDYSAT